MDALVRMLAGSGYLPHGYCFSWSPGLLTIFVVSDVLIFLAYFSMPVAILRFARLRADFPYRWLLWMFAAFILACGATHLLGAITVWVPLYELDALLKALTAIASVATAVALWPLLPQALRLPSPRQLGIANERLRVEIEERKRVEDELRVAKAGLEGSLRAEQELLSAIVESSDDAIIGEDTAGIITSWNRAAQRIFGASAAEAVGQSRMKFIPPELQEEEGRILERVVRGEPIHQPATRRCRLDGSVLHVAVTISPIRDAAGRIIGASKIIRDITDQRRAAQALDDSRALLQAVVDTVPIRIFWKDRDLRYLGCNPAFARDAGKAGIAEVVGRDDFAMAWSDRAEAYRADDRQVIESGEPKLDFEEQATLPGRDANWIRTSKVPLRDRSGSVIGVLGVYEDITERKRTDRELETYRRHLESLVAERTAALEGLTESLQVANDRLEAIFEATGAGILLVRDRTIQRCNHRLEELYRYGAGEMVGLATRALYADQAVWTRAAQEIARAIASGSVYTDEGLGLRKDGSTFRVKLSARAIDANDPSQGLVGLVEDITREHEASESLRRSKEEAEAATRAKAAFLANMSHEIRTPLNGIVGMAHLLRRGGLSPEQQDRLAKLEAAAAHLVEILNAILDLSKIDAGKLTLEECPVRVEAIVANVLSLFEERAHARGLRLAMDVEAMPRDLLGDATRLQQALINYVNNAIKFTEHGEVTLRARVEAQDTGGATLRFEVADTGIGIAPEVLDRLFMAFEQADTSTTRRYGGTGLGLAITRRLAVLMGGEAGARSRPGEGSTFWFTVRLSRGGDVAAPSAPDREDPALELRRRHAGARVLVVEDNEINREVAAAMLVDAGLEVDLAVDGLEAVAKVSATSYRAVLMDMQMPGLDGLEATRVIRRSPEGRGLPIVAMTANAFAEDRARCLEAGMDDFVGKPVEPERLYAVLQHWLESRPDHPVEGDPGKGA